MFRFWWRRKENIQRNFKLKQFHSWFDSLQLKPKKYSSKYSWFTPPLSSSGVPWKVICLLWPQVLLLLLLLLSTTGREKRSTHILILKLAPHSTAKVKKHFILFKKLDKGCPEKFRFYMLVYNEHFNFYAFMERPNKFGQYTFYPSM